MLLWFITSRFKYIYQFFSLKVKFTKITSDLYHIFAKCYYDYKEKYYFIVQIDPLFHLCEKQHFLNWCHTFVKVSVVHFQYIQLGKALLDSSDILLRVWKSVISNNKNVFVYKATHPIRMPCNHRSKVSY